MKVTELRIGNLIADYECMPYYFEVEQIRKYIGFENWVYYRKESIKTKEPIPIPITEEWLVKFGCQKETDSTHDEDFEFIYCGKNKQFRISKNKDGLWSYWTEEIWGFNVDLGRSPAVHTIQNLVFALTGEELTIKQ